MKLHYIIYLLTVALLTACAFDEPDTQINDTNFPLRLQIAEEGADLADAEDYDIEISFADYLGALPSTEIMLTYEIEGEGDFAGAAIDEIIYEFEEDDCVFEREIAFTANTITIPVDPDLGTVPEEFEVVVNFGLPEDTEAEDGEFKFIISNIATSANVVFSDANEFEYGILDNDVAGEWVLEINESDFERFKEVFGSVSADLAELSFLDITGEIKFEFEFEEMKIEIELNEQEEVTECENGEIKTDTENLVIEIEADYDAEDGELALEGSYYNEDGEEVDFIVEAEYSIDDDGDLTITFMSTIDEDHYEVGDELFSGAAPFILIED
ncbi:MAG: hypothetical protein RIC35_17620 [Marinoscillum sp.]